MIQSGSSTTNPGDSTKSHAVLDWIAYSLTSNPCNLPPTVMEMELAIPRLVRWASRSVTLAAPDTASRFKIHSKTTIYSSQFKNRPLNCPNCVTTHGERHQSISTETVISTMKARESGISASGESLTRKRRKFAPCEGDNCGRLSECAATLHTSEGSGSTIAWNLLPHIAPNSAQSTPFDKLALPFFFGSKQCEYSAFCGSCSCLRSPWPSTPLRHLSVSRLV